MRLVRGERRDRNSKNWGLDHEQQDCSGRRQENFGATRYCACFRLFPTILAGLIRQLRPVGFDDLGVAAALQLPLIAQQFGLIQAG